MGTRKGIGRPPLEAEERRRNRLTVTLSDRELAALKEAAGDMSPALYVRKLALDHLARKRRAPRTGRKG